MKKSYLMISLLISSITFAQAPLLVEDFNYSAGDAVTNQGWTAHSGGTTNPVLVTTPGLVFTGYVGSNIGLSAGVNNTGQDVNKLFTAQTAGNVYVSFLVNAADNAGLGGYFFHFFDPTANTAHRARTFIKSKTGKMLVGFSFNASAQQDSLSTLLNFGETYLFVAKYQIVEGALNDSVSLYIFPAGADISVEPTKPTLGPLGGSAADIIPTGIALRQFEAAQRVTVDGFRVKTRWELNKDTPAGLKTIENQTIEFYPNPVKNGYFNILNATNTTKQVEVFDILGKKVHSENTLSNRIDIRHLNAGVYVLKVNAGNGVSSSKLIVK